MDGLTELDLSDTNVGDADVKAVSSLVNLKSLRLANTGVSFQGLRHLKELERLEALDLSGTMLGDSELDFVLRLPALRELRVDHTRVTANALRAGLQGKRLSQLTLDKRQRAGLQGEGLPCEILSSD